MKATNLQLAVLKSWDIWLTLISIAALAAIAATSMPLPSLVCAQDVGVMLDAGWRNYQGQRCHVDYISPLGPLFAMLPGICFKIYGPVYESLKFLPISVTAICTLWMLGLSRTALPKILALLGSSAVGLFAGGLFHPGFEYRALTFAVFYNRVGYGLLCIVALAALLPRNTGEQRFLIFRDASLATALCFLLFLKINFFAAGCLFALCSILLYKRGGWEWVSLLASAAIVISVFGGAIGFRFDLMTADLCLAMFSREGSSANLFFYPLRNFVANADYFVVVVLMMAIVILAAIQDRNCSRNYFASLAVLLVAVTVGFGLTLMQSHGDGRCFPTVVSGSMALVAWNSLSKKRNDLIQSTLCVGTAVVAALVSWPHLAAYQFLKSIRVDQFSGVFEGAALRSWKVAPFNSWGENFIPMVNEGMALIREKAGTNATVQYIDMANNFSFGLGMRSPKGSMLWWDDRSTYSRKAHPDQTVFADTDCLLLPLTRPIQPQPVWGEIYGPYVTGAYMEIGRSANFLLLGKKR